MRQSSLPRELFPTVISIDACQGQEATMTITDGVVQVVQNKSDVGFISDLGIE